MITLRPRIVVCFWSSYNAFLFMSLLKGEHALIAPPPLPPHHMDGLGRLIPCVSVQSITVIMAVQCTGHIVGCNTGKTHLDMKRVCVAASLPTRVLARMNLWDCEQASLLLSACVCACANACVHAHVRANGHGSRSVMATLQSTLFCASHFFSSFPRSARTFTRGTILHEFVTCTNQVFTFRSHTCIARAPGV